MAVVAPNYLQQVQTYAEASLARLTNINAMLGIANMKFKNFQTETANLGSSILLKQFYRFSAANGLIANWQSILQNKSTLTCNSAKNVSFAATSQEMLFNFENAVGDYMRDIGSDAVDNLSAVIEQDLSLNFVSGMTPTNSNVPDSSSGPFRFYGDGTTAINSYYQLVQAKTQFETWGMSKGVVDFVLPDVIIPTIINQGLSQFAPRRADEDTRTWLIGNFADINIARSNQLPTHTAGTVGNSAQTLTVISTNDPTGQNVTQITCSGATNNDANAVFYADLGQFTGNAATLRFMTVTGNAVSAAPVQFRVTQAAGADGSGHVVLNIYPGLAWNSKPQSSDIYQISSPITAGMQITLLPTHKAGGIVGGKSFFVAMPRLPAEPPYPTSSQVDEDTGVSIRMAYGAPLGQNQVGTVYDCIYGALMIPWYSMRVIIPMSQA